MIGGGTLLGVPLIAAQTDIIPRGSRSAVFNQIYWVFLVLGTLVGVTVIGYMLYNAYKYRAGWAADSERSAERGEGGPTLGELPQGSGGGRKLALSFTLSAVIVISLILWTYGTLLYVESPPDAEESMEVEVIGFQFGWEFVYPNGNTTTGTLRVPTGERVRLRVTSRDVFHNFGIAELEAKADAIPGQYTDTWFIANESGTYQAQCYELCGAGHSYMNATVVAMEPAAFERWYANTTPANGTTNASPDDAATTTTSADDGAEADVAAASGAAAPRAAALETNAAGADAERSLAR
jgi:cytochrome c oxidase subunit 2